MLQMRDNRARDFALNVMSVPVLTIVAAEVS
jgi:hypothetical protein